MVIRSGFIACFLLVLLSACQKDSAWFGPVYPPDSNSVELTTDSRILIGCEGNFQLSNASVSVYYPDSNSVVNNAFFGANDKRMGDVVQSITQHGDSIYVVVNNSGVIRVLDAETLVERSVIDGLYSPRYMHKVNNQVALVSNYGVSYVQKVDLTAMSVMGEIPCKGWTEQMIGLNGQVYIAELDSHSLMVLDSHSLALNTRIELAHKPQYLFAKQGELLAVGADEDGKWYVSEISGVDVQSLTPISVSPLGVDMVGEEFVVVTQSHIAVLESSTYTEVQSQVHQAELPYSIYADELAGDYYVCDAHDYVSNGTVYRYSVDLQKVDEFTVGFIPQAVLRAY